MKYLLLVLLGLSIDVYAKDTMSIDSAILKLKSLKAKKMDVVVKGEISSVCQSKGCWLTLKSNSVKNKNTNVCENTLKKASEEADVRVMLGDHSFTVPKDLKGAVVVKGKLKKKKLSSFQLKHFLKDSGCSEAQIKKAKKSLYKYQIVAAKVIKGSKTYSAE